VIEEIPEVLAGERLDRVVAMLTGLSRAASAALVESGGVLVDGDVETIGKMRLAVGQMVDVTVPDLVAASRPMADSSIDVPTVFIDDDLIVVNKPAGLVVHPGHGNADGTLVNALLARFPEIADVGDVSRPGVVHRLDKGTSGLLVVARTQVAYDSLVDQLSVHTVNRRYIALVWGIPYQMTGLIDAPIGRSTKDPLRMAVVTTGKVARTRYEVIDRFDEPLPASLVTCWLETGRTHQIRVHLTAIGVPVVGDTIYNARPPRAIADRPMLHAEHLAFNHPVTGETVEFDAPIAADMAAIIRTFS
jgi:23S rRNA pseudouridine1911/1915/1917 synthase